MKPQVGGNRGPARRAAARGQGLVEFALVLPLIMLLFMTLFDFGRVVYAQNLITQAAREGARVGIAAPAFTQVKYDAIRAAAFGESVGVDLASNGITGDPTQGCSAAATKAGTSGANDATSPSTCFYPLGASAGKTVVVNVRVTVTLLTPIVSNLLGGSFNLTAQSIGFVQ